MLRLPDGGLPGLGVDRCVFLLLDGARADVFRALHEAGELPHVARHVSGRGALADATTVFPSVTNVAYASALTGCFPGTHDLPGGAWLDRARYARLRPSPFRFRHYRGLGHFWHDADLSADVETLFERMPPAENIFGVVSRGAGGRRNAFRFRRIPWALRFTQTGDWTPIDRRCGRRLLARAPGARFVFHATLQVDEHSHLDGPFGPRVIEGYRRFDRWVGRLAARLQTAGTYDRTLLAIASDHGHLAIAHRLDLAGWFAARGLRTLRYPLTPRCWADADAACLVAGDAIAHCYLRGDGWRRRPSGDTLLAQYGPLLDDLLAQPAVDVVAWRANGGGVRVRTRRGSAHVTLDPQRREVTYRPFGADPFGYAPLPRIQSYDAALRATQHTDYPDAPVQVAQLFASARCGDLVVTATPGWDLGDGRHGHRSGHGSLHRDHMRVPVALSRPFDTSAVRLVDIAPTILRWCGESTPTVCDGEALPATAESAAVVTF